MQMDGPHVGFQSLDFGINFDISIGEDGLHLGECVFIQSYSFLYFCVASGVWSYCEAQVFRGAYFSTCFILFPLQRMLHTGI